MELPLPCSHWLLSRPWLLVFWPGCSDERDQCASAIWQTKLTIVAESPCQRPSRAWVASQQDVISALGRDDVVRLILPNILATGPQIPIPIHSDDALAAGRSNRRQSSRRHGGANRGFLPLSGPDVPFANVAVIGRAGSSFLDSDIECGGGSRGLPDRHPTSGFCRGPYRADVRRMLGRSRCADGGTVSMAFTRADQRH